MKLTGHREVLNYDKYGWALQTKKPLYFRKAALVSGIGLLSNHFGARLRSSFMYLKALYQVLGS
jgi:hypothetical protein